MARAFVAKAVWDLPTERRPLSIGSRVTSACAESVVSELLLMFLDRGNFPPAFAEILWLNLPDAAHNMLIRRELGDQIIGLLPA